MQLELNQYDPVGNLDIHRDANNNRTSYIYNERNLLLTESRSLAAISQYQYDVMGNRTQLRDPEGRITRWSHDKRGQVLTEEQLGGAEPLITQYSYDANGNRTGLTKPLNNHWTYHYDERDRLKQIDDPAANSTTYRYDGNGNRLEQTDGRGHSTGYAYDALNRQTRTDYVDGVSEFYDYDANGNRSLLIDGKGQTFAYQFDALNRQLGADYPGSGLAGELLRIGYQYDPNNNPESITEQHRGESDRVTLNRYDAFDRVEGVIDGQAKELRYGFDANGNRTSVRDPDGLSTRYGYDALNRVKSVVSSAGSTAYAYDRSSRKTRVSYPNGSRADSRYDGLGRLEQLSNSQNGAQVSLFGYRYDGNGNRLQQTESNGQAEELTTYAYDDLDRLTEVAYPEQTVSYGYDAAYNRTSERSEEQGALSSDKTLVYDNRNRLEAITDHLDPAASVGYSYDGNGNQIGKDTATASTGFVYDARDKLASIEQTQAGVTTSLGQFRYDHQGLRIEKTTDSGTVGYVYDDQSVLTQFDENGETLAKYDYGAEQLLSLAHRDQGRQFYLFDALGSVSNLTRSDGSIQARYQYDAWGKLRKQSGDSWNSFAFTGHERDKESGLYYFKARFYDPDTGRFLSQDSYLGETDTPPSLHRYLYAYGNPGVYWDADGNQTIYKHVDEQGKVTFSDRPATAQRDPDADRIQERIRADQKRIAGMTCKRGEACAGQVESDPEQKAYIERNWNSNGALIKENEAGPDNEFAEGTPGQRQLRAMHARGNEIAGYGTAALEVIAPPTTAAEAVIAVTGGYVIYKVGGKLYKVLEKNAPAGHKKDVGNGSYQGDGEFSTPDRPSKATDGSVVSAKKPYANPKQRPAYTDGQVDDVWERAKQPDGNVYDPNTGEKLEWNKDLSRAGQWDMGHKPGHEYRKLHKDYMDGKISKEEFLKRYRDSSNYQPEAPSSNRSHRYEEKEKK